MDKKVKSRVFPINNNAACVLKWGWNTFRPYSGTSSSCHRVESEFVTLDNFNNFHNLPKVILDRRNMRNGQWPESSRGCDYCKNVELAGGESDRIYHNKIAGFTPIDFDTGNDFVTPSISEIYLNNTCDLACVYCHPMYSSILNAELSKFGPYPVGITAIKKHNNYNDYLEAYKIWLDRNYNNLSRLSILGGEPLLQKEFWSLLEMISTKKHPTMEISVNTNLNAPPETIKRLVEISKQLLKSKSIKKFDISCSLDCSGPQAEFIRHGISLKRWHENFEFLIQHKWLQINVHHVITSLSLFTTMDLQKQIIEYKNKNSKIQQGYYLVDSGQEEVFHPEIFGPTFFEKSFDELVETFPIKTEWDLNLKAKLIGIAKLQKKSTINKDRLYKLKHTLEQIDFRRATDWKTLFPKIHNFFQEHNI